MRDYFCGWYFKCQSEDHTLAIIPALHKTGGTTSSSIQIISDEGIWQTLLPGEGARVEKRRPEAVIGDSYFHPEGLSLNVSTKSLSAKGELIFYARTPIRYDIMGPFRFVPLMECRHSVFSLFNRVSGHVSVNGRTYLFDYDNGYIEGDRGRSFPKHYAWTQCCFDGGSLMISVADIPLGGLRFTGVISMIQYHGREYRLATYYGAKATIISGGLLEIRQGNMVLTAKRLEETAHPLYAPVSGSMKRMIRENVACRAFYQWQVNGQLVLNFETSRAAFEYEYPQ